MSQCRYCNTILTLFPAAEREKHFVDCRRKASMTTPPPASPSAAEALFEEIRNASLWDARLPIYEKHLAAARAEGERAGAEQVRGECYRAVDAVMSRFPMARIELGEALKGIVLLPLPGDKP